MFFHSSLTKLVSRVYGIQCVVARQLDGHLDKQYLLRDVVDNKEYVLRLKFHREWKNPDAERRNDEVIEHLHTNGFNVPHLIRTKDGLYRSMQYLDNAGGTTSILQTRLSEFLPGSTVYESNLSPGKLMDIAEDIGLLVAKLSQGMLSCGDAPLPGKRRNDDVIWDTTHFYEVRNFLPYIKDESMGNLVEELLEVFKQRVHPIYEELRFGYLHGDMSDTNIVILDKCKGLKVDDPKAKFGIIDFEDFHHGATVFELTVCMAYMMICFAYDESKAWTVASKVLRAYQRCLPLTEAEENVIFPAVLARLATSYVMGMYEVSRQPENEAYLTVHANKCGPLLEMLWRKGETKSRNSWMLSRRIK